MKKIYWAFSPICHKDYFHILEFSTSSKIYERRFFRTKNELLDFLKKYGGTYHARLFFNYIPENFNDNETFFTATSRFVADDIWILTYDNHVVFSSSNYQEIKNRKQKGDKITLIIGEKNKEKLHKEFVESIPSAQWIFMD